MLIGAGIATLVLGGVLVGLRAPILLPGVAVLGALSIAAGITKRLIEVVGPNEVLILSGRQQRLGNRTVGYRVVTGGRAVRLPFVERADRMSLENMQLDLEIEGVYSRGGTRVDLRVTAAVKVDGHVPVLANAVERFLGRGREEIATVARETVSGALRGVAATLTVEEMREDRLRMAQQVVEEAEHDLTKLGLVLDTLNVQEVRESGG